MGKQIYLAGGDDLYHLDMLLNYNVNLIALEYGYILKHKLGTKVLSRVEQHPDISWLLYFNDKDKINRIYNNWGNSGMFTYVVDPQDPGFSWNGRQTLVGPLLNKDQYSTVVIDRTYPSDELHDQINLLHTESKTVMLSGRRNALKYDADIHMVREWMASEKFGVTFIFNNDTFIRIPSKHKELKKNHSEYYKDLGLDAKKIISGDREENLRLAILSWKHYTEHLMAMFDIFGSDDSSQNDALKYNAPLNMDIGEEGDRAIADSLNELALSKKGNSNLPALKPTKKSGLSRPGSRVLCDTCAIKDKCEHYTPGAVCCLNKAFEHHQELDIPNMLETMKSLVEEQTIRLKKAIHIEEILHGGMPTKQVNMELTRLQKNYHQLLMILQEREKINVQKDNLLTKVFGDFIDVEAEPVNQESPKKESIEEAAKDIKDITEESQEQP